MRTILSLVFAMAFVLTGCSGSGLNASETIAVLDESTNIRLGEFSLMLRYQQAQMETYYGSMLGGGGSHLYGLRRKEYAGGRSDTGRSVRKADGGRKGTYQQCGDL